MTERLFPGGSLDQWKITDPNEGTRDPEPERSRYCDEPLLDPIKGGFCSRECADMYEAEFEDNEDDDSKEGGES